MLKKTSVTTSNIGTLITIWRLLDWIYPPFCCNCNQIGYEICPDCWDSIQPLSQTRTCTLCGKRIAQGSICSHCKNHPPAFDQLKSWTEYQGAARQIVMHIKYLFQKRLDPPPRRSDGSNHSGLGYSGRYGHTRASRKKKVERTRIQSI